MHTGPSSDVLSATLSVSATGRSRALMASCSSSATLLVAMFSWSRCLDEALPLLRIVTHEPFHGHYCDHVPHHEGSRHDSIYRTLARS